MDTVTEAGEDSLVHLSHGWRLQGSFDSASASLRETEATLRMTEEGGLRSLSRSRCCAQDDRGAGCALRVRAAALLVFFSGAARTGIVASDLGRAAYHLLHCLEIAGTGHASLLQLTAFLALESFLDFVDRGSHLPWLSPIAIAAHSRNRHTGFRTD